MYHRCQGLTVRSIYVQTAGVQTGLIGHVTERNWSDWVQHSLKGSINRVFLLLFFWIDVAKTLRQFAASDRIHRFPAVVHQFTNISAPKQWKLKRITKEFTAW